MRQRNAGWPRPSRIGRGSNWLRPVALAAMLSGTLVLELLQPFAGASPVSGDILASDPPISEPPPRADGPRRQARQLTSGLLARPLFAPSRRAAALLPVATTAIAAFPRLAGVIIAPDGARAILEPSEGKPVVVANGSSVDGFVVKSIAQDMVLLTGPGGERDLRITYDPKMLVKPHVLQATNLGATE